MRPEYPERAPKARFSVAPHALVSSGSSRVKVVGPSLGCLGGLSLARLRRHVPVRGPLYSGLSSVEPFPLLPGRSTASPTSESSTTAVQVHRRGSNPLSSLSSRRRGSTLTQSRPSVVYHTDPPVAGTPRSGASDGSSLVCLHRDPH